MVSVIIPVYNTRLDLVNRCIRSLEEQSYSDIEMLIVLNGCEETYTSNIKSNISDKRIRFIELKDKGVSAARNAGIDASRGEYLAFADADDTVSARFVEDALNILNDNRLDIVSGGISFIYKNNKHDMMINTGVVIKISGEEARQQILFPDDTDGDLKGYRFSSPCAKLYRKSIVGDIRFNEDVFCREDIVFNYRLVSKTDRIGIFGDIWYSYYQYGDSSIHSLDKRMVCNNINILSDIYRDNSENTRSHIRDRLFVRLFYIYLLETVYYSDSYRKWKDNVDALLHGPEYEYFKIISNEKDDKWAFRQKFIIDLINKRNCYALYMLGKMKKYIKGYEDGLFNEEPI